MPPKNEQELDRSVLYYLRMHKGQQNAITRWDLCMQVFEIRHISAVDRADGNSLDRQVRKSIERLRRNGHLICNLGNGDGYFVATSPEEYQAFRALYVSHAIPIIETAREMDKGAAELWPNPLQPSLL